MHAHRWGRQPFFQEYDSNGNALWAARFGVGDVQSYRDRFKWTGRPRTPPSITVAGQCDNITVYASWNGATEVKQWRLLGSTTDAPQRPTFLSTVSKDDFETCITYTRGGYDYFQVVALDSLCPDFSRRTTQPTRVRATKFVYSAGPCLDVMDGEKECDCGLMRSLGGKARELSTTWPRPPFVLFQQAALPSRPCPLSSTHVGARHREDPCLGQFSARER